jgi:non-ribosomal peptide synthetase component E (peptide arylation enzyme)
MAVVDADRAPVSYAEVASSGDAMADALRADAVHPGDQVAVLELISFMRAGLARFKAPDYFCLQALPKISTGKNVARDRARDLAEPRPAQPHTGGRRGCE